VDYCSTTAGATLVADHSPESSKIVAWAIPSGWSASWTLKSYGPPIRANFLFARDPQANGAAVSRWDILSL
jgi:hypothetical protein